VCQFHGQTARDPKAVRGERPYGLSVPADTDPAVQVESDPVGWWCPRVGRSLGFDRRSSARGRRLGVERRAELRRFHSVGGVLIRAAAPDGACIAARFVGRCAVRNRRALSRYSSAQTPSCPSTESVLAPIAVAARVAERRIGRPLVEEEGDTARANRGERARRPDGRLPALLLAAIR
jgi:hypothetical protein